jgi:hypothetical protein
MEEGGLRIARLCCRNTCIAKMADNAMKKAEVGGRRSDENEDEKEKSLRGAMKFEIALWRQVAPGSEEESMLRA